MRLSLSQMRLEVLSSHSPFSLSSSSPPPPHTTAHKMIALAASATPSVTQNTSNTKRPKLSLQTASLPMTFNNSSTGLARTCTTASPTVRNTFSNAYETTRPLSTIESPSPCRLTSKSSRYPSPFAHNHRTSESTPYQQPFGVRSVLRNSPLKKMSVRRQSVSMSAADNRRVLFPVKKQVTFHYQLEEEIRTVRFVARHSDLDSDLDSDPEPESEPESEPDSSSESTGSHSDSTSCSSGEDDGDIKNPQPQRKRRKSIPSERKIRAAALRDGLSENHYAASLTAISQTNRSKRRCKWRWTLGENTSDSEFESPSSSVLVEQSRKDA